MDLAVFQGVFQARANQEVNGQNRPVPNLPVVDLFSQPREMPTPKPLKT